MGHGHAGANDMRIPPLLIAIILTAAAPIAFGQGILQPKEGPLHLFNGQDFDGWVRYLSDPKHDPDATWEIRGGGVIHCTGRPEGYLRTRQSYSNYRLTLEWRWPREGGHCGVLVHVQEGDDVWPKSIETGLSAGHAGDFWLFRTDFGEREDTERRRVEKREESSENPVGEWNKMVIECSHDAIKVFVNGVLQNRATHATVDRGHIALQSVGSPIEFRNIVLHPLDPPAQQDAAVQGEENGRNS
jgi:hypothetical protein